MIKTTKVCNAPGHIPDRWRSATGGVAPDAAADALRAQGDKLQELLDLRSDLKCSCVGNVVDRAIRKLGTAIQSRGSYTPYPLFDTVLKAEMDRARAACRECTPCCPSCGEAV